MIENIYSNEHKESKWNKNNAMFRMPKNIRQVGQVDTAKKIYIEDYVMTYIRQLAMKDYSNYKVAVLLGHFIKADGAKNIFISGAVEVSNVDIEMQSAFSNETWTSIYDDVKKYFDDVEIVGWYIAKPGLILETTDQLLKVHVDNFAGQDKTLFMFDSIEKEEAFYVYDNNKLCRQRGYYIYYEKNEEMQNYMVENKKVPTTEAGYEDRAIKQIRQIIETKKENKIEKDQSVVRLLYGASTLLAVVVLVIGATMLTNYDQMQGIEKTLDVITEHVVYNDKDVEDPNTTLDDGDKVTEVETMSGNIEKIKEGRDVIPGEEPKESVESKGEGAETETPFENESEKTNEESTKDTVTTDTDKKDIVVEDKNDSDTKSDSTKDSSTKEIIDTAKKEVVKPKTTQTSKKEVTYYTIKEGDSLLTISEKFYHSVKYVDEIMKVNNIEDQNKILIGQKIIIP